MAIWEKVFRRINWENEPSVASPLDEDNLNRGDLALDRLDDRVIELNNRTSNLEGYEQRVAVLEQQAKESQEKASQSEINAKDSEDNSLTYRNLSESWAVGTPDGIREDEKTNNSKYWSDLAAQSAANAGYMAFEIKDDGCLWIGRTANVSERIVFEIINDSDLEVRIYA